MKRFSHICFPALLALSALGLLSFPGQVTAAARQALEQCLTVVIPSLFPFLVLSNLLVALGSGGFRRCPPGLAALLLGLVGGYPVGAHTLSRLREEQVLSREEANRLLVFCNNCGPAFLLSTAGTAVLGSPRAGWLLWAGHLLGTLTLALLTPGRKRTKPALSPSRETPPLSAVFTRAVTDAANAALRLSAFVVLFGVILRLLTVTGALPIGAQMLHLLLGALGFTVPDCAALLSGGLELTSGILSLAGRQPTPGILALAAFLLAWGGVSVHCQTAASLQGEGWRFFGYLLGKLCHGLLASGFTWLLARLLPQREPVTLLAGLSVSGVSLRPFPLCAALAWFGVAALCLFAIKKGGKT